MTDISSRFQTLRMSRGVSVYRLSKEADVSENYIHKIERGESQPSVYILDKLLGCLGVTLPEFLNGDSSVMYPSDFERELIENVRMLPEEKAAAILHIAKLMGQ
ncbi:MAG: helix-turn-helix transcriptional regulator [Lachnospiraceae bacterium]|nr:helix-turn-helix transcriptional regulator [Lachnospiraceae bacterium]MCI8958893.1 helix-turn-helix transcriptional regulator [Lachnospiraceae bacterium]